MRKSRIVATFSRDVQTVWNIVTDNTNYSWRSDLSKIEVADDGNSFTEYSKGGFNTTFTITMKKPYERYEFNMNNKNMNGHWIGIFSETTTGGTQIDLTEEIKIPNPIIRVASYLFMNLKKMQETYVDDLRKALGE